MTMREVQHGLCCLDVCFDVGREIDPGVSDTGLACEMDDRVCVLEEIIDVVGEQVPLGEGEAGQRLQLGEVGQLDGWFVVVGERVDAVDGVALPAKKLNCRVGKKSRSSGEEYSHVRFVPFGEEEDL